MSLLLPLGLLGLLGVVALIIIYIIKPKYQEKTITSTYIWHLSRKYRKRKIPFEMIKSSLLLIVQILSLILMALLLAKPARMIKSKESEEMIIILDNSGSMLAEDNGKTRFDRAKDRVRSIINDKNELMPITIVVGNENPDYLVQRKTDANFIRNQLNKLEPSFGDMDVTVSMEKANEILDINPNADVMLITDRDVSLSGYVEVVNVSKNEWNLSILDSSYEKMPGGSYDFYLKVASFNKDMDVKLVLDFYGAKGAPDSGITNGLLTLEKDLTLTDDEIVEVSFTDTKVSSFKRVEGYFKTKNNGVIPEDSFKYDNKYLYYGGEEKKYKVLLVTQPNTGDFLKDALNTLGNNTYTETNIATYNTTPAMQSGYDLYIFNGVNTINIPNDGAIWFLNPPQNINNPELGFSTGNYVENAGIFWERNLVGTNEKINNIMDNVGVALPQAWKAINKFTNVTYDIDIYTPVMNSSAESNEPLMLVGEKNGIKTIIMAFDLNYGYFGISTFPILVDNMANYSLNRLVDEYIYNLSDEVIVNSLPNTSEVVIEAIDNDYHTTTIDSFPFRYSPVGIGRYEIKQYNMIDGKSVLNTENSTNFYVKMLSTECDFATPIGFLANEEYENNVGKEIETKIIEIPRDISYIFVWFLFAFLIIEWGLQYREQY